MCTSTVSSHSLQRTAQHQWNLHSHLVMRVTRVVSYPLPQHITSQPSVPRDTLLHTRPAVPREPGEGSDSRSGCSPLCSNTSLPTHPQRLLVRLGISVCGGDRGCDCFSGEIPLFLSQHVLQWGLQRQHFGACTCCALWAWGAVNPARDAALVSLPMMEGLNEMIFHILSNPKHSGFL